MEIAHRTYRAAAAAPLATHGMREDVIAECVEQMLDADCSGHTSHGLATLARLVRVVGSGLVNTDPQPRIFRQTVATAVIDADGSPGAHAGTLAVREAVQRAQDAGCATVGIRHAHTTGYLGHFTTRVARAGYVVAMTSATRPMVHPYGGRDALVGTNPLSIAFPTAGEPMVLDMATSAGARGQVRRAARNDDAHPPGWAIDSDGEPTNDPHRALDGTLSPFGAHKGSGLAIMLGLLAGPLLDLAVPAPTDGDTDVVGIGECGDLIVVLDPSAFGTEASALAAAYADRVRSSRPQGGAKTVRVPGDGAAAARAANASSVHVDDDVLADVDELLANHGCTPIAWS